MKNISIITLFFSTGQQLLSQADSLQQADCILLATDHTAYDYDFILQHAKLIVDTRHVFNGRKGAEKKVTMA